MLASEDPADEQEDDPFVHAPIFAASPGTPSAARHART